MNGIPFCGDTHAFIRPLTGPWTDSRWGRWGRSREQAQARLCPSSCRTLSSSPFTPRPGARPPPCPRLQCPSPSGLTRPALSSRFSHGHLCPPAHADAPGALASSACKLGFWTGEQPTTSAAAACRAPRMCLCDSSLSRAPPSPPSAHRTSPPGVHWAARAQQARV